MLKLSQVIFFSIKILPNRVKTRNVNITLKCYYQVYFM